MQAKLLTRDSLALAASAFHSENRIRYFFKFSYLGTTFSGSQSQGVFGKLRRVQTVADVLTDSFQKLQPTVPVMLMPSSRTDQGVHALCNTAHVDLAFDTSRLVYAPGEITKLVNHDLARQNVPIRIFDTLIVPQSFGAQKNAKSRTYVYRIAVAGDAAQNNIAALQNVSLPLKFDSIIPVVEDQRCWLVHAPFSAEKFFRAVEIFRGTHNFLTFSGQPDGDIPREPVRHMELAYARIPATTGVFERRDVMQQQLQVFEVVFRCRGFLYHQVRRMTGAAVACARGLISLKRIQWMLDNPAYCNFDRRIGHTPPTGLFLVNVAYDWRAAGLTQTRIQALLKKMSPRAQLQEQRRQLIQNLTIYHSKIT